MSRRSRRTWAAMAATGDQGSWGGWGRHRRHRKRMRVLLPWSYLEALHPSHIRSELRWQGRRLLAPNSSLKSSTTQHILGSRISRGIWRMTKTPFCKQNRMMYHEDPWIGPWIIMDPLSPSNVRCSRCQFYHHSWTSAGCCWYQVAWDVHRSRQQSRGKVCHKESITDIWILRRKMISEAVNSATGLPSIPKTFSKLKTTKKIGYIDGWHVLHCLPFSNRKKNIEKPCITCYSYDESTSRNQLQPRQNPTTPSMARSSRNSTPLIVSFAQICTLMQTSTILGTSEFGCHVKIQVSYWGHKCTRHQ